MVPAELTPPVELPTAEALTLLRDGTLSIEGRVMSASNSTLYCAVEADGVAAACAYKPVAGERPLWDFPDGTLAEREVASFVVSEASGWGIVPPTIYRDGPAGPGMVQLWIADDESTELLRLIRRRDSEALRRIAVLDAVLNNADRKGGHLLPTAAGHIYGIDHGVTFHPEDKLRTVLWQWAGRRLPDDAVDVLSRLRAELEGGLGDRLRELLTVREVKRTISRVDRLLASGRHPEPSGEWPAVPWPPM